MHEALVRHVVATSGLSEAEAMRLIDDVTAYFDEPVEAVVRRRHRELQTYGLKNPAIFARISDELATRTVAAPPLSERQLRRIVYG